MPSKRVFSVGVLGLSYFLNRSNREGTTIYRYYLCKVRFPAKKMKKVRVTKDDLDELRKLSRNRALKRCKELMREREQIPFVNRNNKRRKPSYRQSTPPAGDNRGNIFI